MNAQNASLPFLKGARTSDATAYSSSGHIITPVRRSPSEEFWSPCDEAQFVRAIECSFAMYKEHGARSSKKLEPLHGYIAGVLSRIWGPGFQIHCMATSRDVAATGKIAGNIIGKERTVEGKYYPKDIDITVTRDGKDVFCLGVKFVTSNYKQNANNYFEGMMGETANIQARGDLAYAQLIILRHNTPYYAKNNSETPSKIEVISDRDIQKYARLILDIRQAHQPRFIAIPVIELDEMTGRVSPTDPHEAFSPEIARLLMGQLSIRRFLSEISDYKDLYNTGR